MALGFNTIILDTQEMSDSFTSSPIYLGQQTKYCVHAVFSDASSPVGTLSIEVSIDGQTWAPLSGSSYSISSAGDKMYDVGYATYRQARIKYVRGSGSGTMTLYASVKD